MKRTPAFILAGLVAAASGLWAADPKPVNSSWDSRLGPPKTLNDYFPFKPPADKKEWAKRRRAIREQILVACGLWPLPAKTPLHPVIHGKIDRDGYTVEKVFFASYPGHYVSGNLYRPKGKTGKLPAVLSPHGHWRDGRFFDAGEAAARAQIRQKAETTLAGARFPLQARCAQLARMGCVVFHYDMVGNADSRKIDHMEGFRDVRADLRLQSFMGLQTWNSIRALDFLLSLPDVDPKRVGVTGASGGGTQTFMLCAIDDRPAVAFPAVMVSTGMQGGCVCENCSLLRLGTGNVEFAALFAPKPLGMTGADDWTKEIETKGLPELKKLYKLYGAEDKVMAQCFKQFGHNYNQVSREVMYNWFNKHLKLGQKSPVVEKPFVPVPPRDLSVYDKNHPLPKDATGVERLRRYLTRESDRQLAALVPKDAEGLKKFRATAGTALRVMVHDRLPQPSDVEVEVVKQRGDAAYSRYYLRRTGTKERVAAYHWRRTTPGKTVLVWIDPQGKEGFEALGKKVATRLRRKTDVLVVDVFPGRKKDYRPAVNKDFAAFTLGYNRALLANRVHDILTAVRFAQRLDGKKQVHLIGVGEAGPWVVLARALCGAAVSRTAADLNQFRFEEVWKPTDDNLLPGALKYGDLPAFAALCAPGELYLYNQRRYRRGKDDAWKETWAQAAYQAAGAANNLHETTKKVDLKKVVDWLLR
jgi:dienelactone hydrolase